MEDSMTGRIIFFLTFALALWRTPRLFRVSESATGTLACWVGAAAFFSLAYYSAIDGLLGHRNYAKLVENSLAVLAFACMASAVFKLSGINHRNHRNQVRLFSLGGIVLSLIGSAVTFISADHTTTTNRDIIYRDLGRDGIWFSLVIYMVTMVIIGIVLIRGFRGRKARVDWFFRIGALTLIVGSVADLVNISLAHYGDVSSDPAMVTSRLCFVLFFYAGPVVLCAGFIAVASLRGRSRYGVKIAAEFATVLDHHGIDEAFGGDDSAYGLYRGCIHIRDLEAQHRLVLSRADQEVVWHVEEFLCRKTAPKMSKERT